MLAKILILLGLMAVVIAIPAVTTAGAPAPRNDLSVEILPAPPHTPINPWPTVIVTNNYIDGYPGTAARNVIIQLTPDPSCAVSCIASGHNLGTYNRRTGVWTIPSIPPGGSVQRVLSLISRYTPTVTLPDPNGRDLFRMHATVVSGEPQGYSHNNEAEVWYVRGIGDVLYSYSKGNAGVKLSVDNRHPAPSDEITFRLTAINASVPLPLDIIRYQDSFQTDVRVEIELSPGLQLIPGSPPQASGSTTFNEPTMTWSVGTIGSLPELTIPVTVTNATLEQIPLAERCLTARITNVVPKSEREQKGREDDQVTVCLGADPPIVINQGEIILWWLHDCVGTARTQPPCRGADGLKLFARAERDIQFRADPQEGINLPAVQRVDVVDGDKTFTYLDPESVIVQIPDPRGRMYDSRTHSLTDGNTVSWQTASEDSEQAHPGLRVWYSRTGFNNNIGDWSNVVRTVSVSGLDGAAIPGRVRVRHDSRSTSTFYDPAPPSYTHMRAPFNLASTTNNHNDYILEFTNLGTYVVNFHALATRSDGVTTYPASADYVFHVGPIAELAVMDGGSSPLAVPGQTAYTIQAANNGPDTAPAVRVTLTNVPEGSNYILTDGTYQELIETCAGGLCEAEWDLGELPVSDNRPAGGQTEYPTLTLIAPTGVPVPEIQASIANTQPYSVVIDGASHSTHYFDYIEENNTATIVAQSGTGGGAPRSLSVLTYADPPIAVVTWGPVESVNGWPVSGYELWTARGEETCRKPRLDQAGEEVTGRVHLDYSINPNELTCYYVRAVNTQKVPGYWSEPALTLAGISDLTQLTVQGGAGVVEGGDAQFTISASPAPVAGDTLQVQYTVSQRGNFVAGGDLGQDSVIIDSRGRADITVPTEADETGEADGAVVLTLLSGSGYALSSARSASVAVADDDDPTVSFAEPAAGVVKENAGPHDVVIQVEPAPHEDFPIGYTTDGDAVAGAGVNGDYTITGSGTVMARAGQSSVVIPVQPTDNGTSEPDETLILWLSQGDGYALGSLQVYSLTIVDDDGPRAEFARAESGVDEDGGTHNVVINLDPSPAGNVSINYQMGGPATRDVDYSITGVTGPTASVSASAGDSRVTIPVNITDDSLTEGDETVELTLLPSPDYNLGTQRTHALTIRDDDLPRVSFAAGTSNPVEGDGMYDVTVRLDQPAPSDFTLRYGVGGDATRNRDYRVANTIPVSATATSVAIRVDITDDGDNEPDETVVLTLRAGSGYAVGDPGEHTLTIADDDPPLVAFAAASASVSERGGPHRTTILLEPGPHADITVRYTVDGTATEGDDFTISDCGGDPCTAMVGRGQGQAAVPITILNDGDAEGDETVVLTLTGGDGYDLALPVRYELTIKDDDAPVATFTAASGEVAEGDSGSVIPHNVEVKLDRPAPAGGTLLTFSVSSPPNIGATSSDDYGVPATMTARVQAGDSSTDIPVTIVGDGDNEADEIVVLTLEPGRGYSVGSADEYTLTIVDDDHDENTPVASLNNPNFHGTGATQLEWWEDGGAARPTWHVTGNFTGDVIFQYVGGTATLHEDFTVERIQGQTIEKAGDVFTVRSLESPQDFDRDTGVRWARFIFVPIRDDRAEGRETAIFRVLNGPGYTVGEPTELTIIIKD